MNDQNNNAITQIDSSFPLLVNRLKYIPIEKIIELRKKHLSCEQIAKVLGCSKANIVQRLHRISDDLDLTDNYVKDRATVFAYHGRKIINSITESDIQKAGLLEKVKAVSFLHNAERLDRGQSTQNVIYAELHRIKDRIDEELKELDQYESK